MGPVGLGVAVALIFFCLLYSRFMVNKPNIDKLIDRYQEQINEQYSHIESCLYTWADRKPIIQAGFHALDTINLEYVYESALVSAVTAWQSFSADWVVAALTNDSSVLRQKLAANQRLVRVTVGSAAVFRPAAELRKHPAQWEVRGLLEQPSEGSYLSVNYQSHWGKFKNLMGPDYVAKVDSLTANDFTFIEFCTKLRNMSAHRSDESYTKVKEAVTGPQIRKIDREEKVKLARDNGIRRGKVGHYLAAEMRNPYGGGRQNTRLAFMLGRLRRVSERLR